MPQGLYKNNCVVFLASWRRSGLLYRNTHMACTTSGQGAPSEKKVGTFFGGCGKRSACLFNCVFEFPLSQNAPKRKKNRAKQPREERKTEEKKQHFL
jgi:hypothetical protein